MRARTINGCEKINTTWDIVKAWRCFNYPPEFFEQLYRLRGVPFKANMLKPQYLGHLVNNITYDRMAPELRSALKEERAKTKKSGQKCINF